MLDDRAANGAGAGEQVEHRLPVACPDRPRIASGRSEAVEHFQHRPPVVQEHVAPHGRVRRGDPGEIAKSAGRILDHLAAGHLLEVGCGADDRIGDQMRDMAGHRQHQVVMLGIHDLDRGAEPFPEIDSSATASGGVSSGGVMMHQRCWNRVAKPASGPLCSVPATGWAGMTVWPGSAARSAWVIDCLDEPTSLIIASGGSCRGAMPARGPAIAPDRHAEDHEVRSATASIARVADFAASPRSGPSRTAGSAS